jgi:hypothetical protein
MDTAPRVFVGGSSEAQELATCIGTVLEEARATPVVWNTDAFRPGRTLLDEIERFPSEVQAAVLLATPDVWCSRGNGEFWAPVPNVLFEYGYLAGRLTRDRVAVCRAGQATMPSDVAGVKLIEIGEVDLKKPRIPDRAATDLRWWIAGLSVLPPCFSPTTQLHGYSGRWEIRNSFSLWRNFPLDRDDHEVHFDGWASLSIPTSGEGGSGFLYGTAYVSLGGYRAEHRIANEIRKATVDKSGGLNLDIEVVNWSIATERGVAPHERAREELQDKRFGVALKPDFEQPKVLRGRHEYEKALKLYSVADEKYTYKG